MLKLNHIRYRILLEYHICNITLEKAVNITHGHVYQVVVTAYVYNSAGKLVETQTAETSIKAY